MSGTKTRRTNEEEIMAELENGQADAELDEERADAPDAEFKFYKGRPLPEGFENPECGDPDHRCVDRAGNYQPDWVQIKIESRSDNDQKTVVFPGEVTYALTVDIWSDCPPRIKESLRSAVETHHSLDANQKHINLSQHPEHKKIERRRFVWDWMPSA